jgi:hypothetical protein
MELTFKKAFKLAQALETADKNFKEWKSEKPTVLKVSGSGSRPQHWGKTAGTSCYCCGDKRHAAMDCQFKTAKCWNCGKVGHIAKVCWGKSNSYTKIKQGGTHLVVMTDEDKNESETEYALYNMTGDNNQLLLVRPLVNGKQLAMEVDTGATLSIIGRQT